jgi:hypothetical protein
MIRYCAGKHDTETVVINVPIGAPPYCCEACADPKVTDQCACDITDFSAPHIDALPPSHPLVRKS